MVSSVYKSTRNHKFITVTPDASRRNNCLSENVSLTLNSVYEGVIYKQFRHREILTVTKIFMDSQLRSLNIMVLNIDPDYGSIQL